jgi:UDPglucose--hexose-1-phosphate uridylyltransferase
MPVTIVAVSPKSLSPASDPAVVQTVEAAILGDVAAATSRFDPIRGRWTIIAGNRDQRPIEFSSLGEQLRGSTVCPFCAGNESETPPAVLEIEAPFVPHATATHAGDAAANWIVRVVPNKFPAVCRGGQPDAHHGKIHELQSSHNLMPERQIGGGHEVVIESHRHVRSVSELDVDEIQATFAAYVRRIQYWNERPGIANVSVFKNVGSDAGASLSHGHSQIVATDQVPDEVNANYHRMLVHRVQTGCCLQCDLIREEQKRNERVVATQNGLIAFCPFASHLPMMLRITSVEHHGCLSHLPSHTIDDVARLLHRAVGWLESSFGKVAYNFVLHCHPVGIRDSVEAHHWALDLFPRLTKVAGFEWNTGMMINPTPPELAAARYREQAQCESLRHRVSNL